jgi:hypothetical protein
VAPKPFNGQCIAGAIHGLHTSLVDTEESNNLSVFLKNNERGCRNYCKSLAFRPTTTCSERARQKLHFATIVGFKQAGSRILAVHGAEILPMVLNTGHRDTW